MKTQVEIEEKLSEITEIKNDLQKHYYDFVKDGDIEGSRFYAECRNEKNAQINALMWVLGYYKDIK